MPEAFLVFVEAKYVDDLVNDDHHPAEYSDSSEEIRSSVRAERSVGVDDDTGPSHKKAELEIDNQTEV